MQAFNLRQLLCPGRPFSHDDLKVCQLLRTQRAQGDVNTQQSISYGVPGSITLVTRGQWTLHIVISGPAGRGEAAIPLTAVTFPAIPAWLAWNIGLLPVYGLLLFWITQSRKQRSGDDPAQPSVSAVSKEVS